MAQKDPSSNKTIEYAESMGLVAVSLKIAMRVVLLCAYDRHVGLLVGETSTGKTAMLRQLADFNNMPFKFYGLAHKEASDITGPMMPSSDGRTYRHLPPADIPILGHDNELAFLMKDMAEINRGPSDVHNAIMPMLIDRQFGTHTLGPNVILVADMNPPDGDYAVTASFSSDPAIRRRTCQIVVATSATDTLDWARDPSSVLDLNMPKLTDEGVLEPVDEHRYRPWHPSVIEFLQGNVDIMNDEQSRDAGKVFACPATWHACSDTLYTLERLNLNMHSAAMQLAVLTKFAGHVGHKHAQSLLEYHNKEASALDPRDILLHFSEPGNKSARRVKKLLEGGHGDRVGGALNNVARVWAEGVASEQFTNEDVAANLAALFEIVPTDIGVGFMDAITETDTTVGASGGGPSLRSTNLVSLLHKQGAFVSFRDRRKVNLKEKAAKKRAAEEGLE